MNDLNAIGNAGILESSFRDLYPEELELHRENSNDTEATFLDLDIKIKNNKSQISLFDKRASFPSTSLECLKNSGTYPQIYSTCQLELNV